MAGRIFITITDRTLGEYARDRLKSKSPFTRNTYSHKFPYIDTEPNPYIGTLVSFVECFPNITKIPKMPRQDSISGLEGHSRAHCVEK